MEQSVASVFVADSILGLLNSVLNKRTVLAFGRWKSKSRYWFAGTANRGEGKSPCTKPLLRALTQAMHRHPSHCPGTPNDRFHFDESSTQASAEDKIRFTNGYLCVQSDEASTLLSRAVAEGREANRSVYLDWRHWLNTAHGDQFSHSKEGLRQELHKRKVQNPADRAEETRLGVCIDPTNVHMLFFQQELLWDTFWAQCLHCND